MCFFFVGLFVICTRFINVVRFFFLPIDFYTSQTHKNTSARSTKKYLYLIVHNQLLVILRIPFCIFGFSVWSLFIATFRCRMQLAQNTRERYNYHCRLLHWIWFEAETCTIRNNCHNYSTRCFSSFSLLLIYCQRLL